MKKKNQEGFGKENPKQNPANPNEDAGTEEQPTGEQEVQEDQDTQEDTQVDATQEEQPTGMKGKTFSQEEVNTIVQNRLNQFKKHAEEEQNTLLAAKEAELEQRALSLSMREALRDNNLPDELGTILKVSSEDDIANVIDILKRNINSGEQKGNTGFHMAIGATPMKADEDENDNSALRRVMGLK